MTAWSFMSVAYSAGGQTGTSFGEIVGGEYFSALGVAPSRGRLLQPSDDRPEAPPVVVISHGTWQRVFAGAEDVVGRTMKINGHMFEVVGVASPEFRGVFNNGLTPSALWVPIASTAQVYRPSPGLTFDPHDRESRFLLAKGVLKKDKTIDDVRAELGVIAAQLDAAYPLGRGVDPRLSSPYNRSRPWYARPMADVRISESMGTAVVADGLAMVLMLAVGAVLLVACSNLANLALARGSGRQHEIAVRLALGASRWRLVRESLTESLVLAVAGGLLGLGVARVLIVILSGELALAGTVGTLQLSPRLDVPVLIVAAVATALALIVAGLGPALQSTRGDVRTALAGDGSTGAAPRWRGRRFLITGQVTVSVVLLAVAALGITQLRSIQRQDYGFALHELAVADVDFEGQGYDNARIERMVEGFFAQMSSRREAVGVTVATGLPAGPTTFRRGQITGADNTKPVYAEIIAGGPALIPTLGIPITHGRAWDATDPAAARVVVVSEWTARALFGTTNVVGREVRTSRRSGIRAGLDRDRCRGRYAERRVDGSEGAAIYVPFHHDYGARWSSPRAPRGIRPRWPA